MKKYGITTPEKFLKLCESNDLLSDANPAQFKKVVHANELGCHVHTMTLLIWMCSADTNILDIIKALTLARVEYERSEES